MTEEPTLRAALARLRPYVERARNFSGWDFSAVQERRLEPAAWDYEALVREAAGDARSVLDMGTGGGEVLARLRDALPARVLATEEWGPNVPVAARRLRPLGVEVVWCSDLGLPFADAAFDLVINRHEWLDPADVARVLRPGGRAITQQVGHSNWQELNRCFPRRTDHGDIFENYRHGFEAAGLRVQSRQQQWPTAYATLGDVVYMLMAAPWEIPDFDVERDLDALLALEAACSTADGVVLTESRDLLIADKPAGRHA